MTPKKIQIVIDGIIKIIKNLKCKMVCCCKAECGRHTPPSSPNIIKFTEL